MSSYVAADRPGDGPGRPLCSGASLPWASSRLVRRSFPTWAAWPMSQRRLNQTQPTAPTDTPPQTQGGLVTPPGTRLVGMGPIAVAVPEHWGTNKVKCGQPLADTVVFEGTGTRACLVPERDVSSVHFDRISSWTPSAGEQATTIDLDGVEATVSGVHRIPPGSRQPSYPFLVGRVRIPSHDIEMWVRSTDEQVVRRILDSVQAVPAGYVAIPVRSGPYEWTAAALEHADLNVMHKTVYREGWAPGVLLSSDPPLGSVVPRGSTVTVNVSTAMAQPEKDDHVLDHLHQLAIGASATRRGRQEGRTFRWR